MTTSTYSPASFAKQWPQSNGAPPLFATPRSPDRRSDGPAVEVIARTLGTPLIPWQSHVSAVANERRPDGSYEYQVVVVSVPRQTGKTTLLRATGVHRCLVCRRDVFYTAQTGKDARARWMDLVKALRVNPALKPPRTIVRLRGGSEHVEFPGGNVFQVFAPTPESLHGYTPPTVMVDEGFALDAMAGELLMGAIGPAQITITDKQIWVVSTAGTAESVWLHDWIDAAIDGAPRVAGFVWGARDDQDPYNADDIAAFHPGVGFPLNGRVLAATDVLEQAARNSRAEYERAYANRRTLTAAHLIPAESWRPLTDTGLQPPTRSDVVLTFDVAGDRQSSAVVASWPLEDGRVAVKVVKAGPGLAWLAGTVDDLDRDWRPRRLAAANHGPVLEVVADLEHRGVRVDRIGDRDYATASGAFLTAVENGRLVHDGDAVLERSVVGLATRPAVSDGVALSRRLSAGDSAPGIAAAVGSWLATQETAGDAGPLFTFGES